MKTYFIILVNLLIYFDLSYSQIIRFNNVYDPWSTWDHATSVIVENDGYFITGTTGGDTGSNRKLALLKIDLNGNVIWYKYHSVPQRSFYEYAHPDVFIKTSDNCYVFSGILTSTNGSDVVLIKFNNNGDTLWQKTYGDSLDWGGFQCQETLEKGFIITGYQSISSSNSDLLLLKTDSAGNLKWKKTVNYTQEIGYSVICTPDSGYLVGGGKTNGYYYAGLIVKFDSLGNVKFTKSIYGPYSAGLRNLALTKDNNYIACGYYNDTVSGSYEAGRAFIIKFNNLNQTLWQKFYGRRGVGSGLASVKVLPDNSIIACGTQGSGWQQGYHANAYVLKVNADGDSIFSREYDKYNIQGEVNEFTTIVPTADGGFIASGTLNYIQDMWVVKMDSLGCDIAGCELLGINEIHDKKYVLNVYPNPACKEIIFSINHEQNERLCNVQVIIYNLIGTEQARINISPDKATVLSTDNFSNGIYFYSFEAGGIKIETGKIIINK